MFKRQFIPKKSINMKEEYYFIKFQEKINDKRSINNQKQKFYIKLIYFINRWL